MISNDDELQQVWAGVSDEEFGGLLRKYLWFAGHYYGIVKGSETQARGH